MDMNIEKKLSHIEVQNRENSVSHLAYEREMAFFQSIKEGDVEQTRKLFKPFNSEEMGELSPDKMRNLKYHLIITVALITRYCIEGGMEMEVAYNLSDIYVRKIDQCRDEEEIRRLHSRIVEDYVQRMQTIHHTNSYPKAVTICLDYIYNNLHARLSLEKLAEIAGLSPAYLSKLFRREVGMTISGYITHKRVEAAENMLKYSDLSCLEIANYLCFSSESHFIQVFHKVTGHTPRRYRQKYFRIH